MFPVVSPGWKMAVLKIETGLGEGLWWPQMTVSLCEGQWNDRGACPTVDTGT